ncbi:MAG: succinylglutamate desuccinylase/aspartoacylase family protein [Balneolaceae bacterium]|nr:succinylglutamate desuccinylase/aspartoacylase family protein [Balneolaceae bacterium]
MANTIKISKYEIAPGQHEQIQLNIARLPTYTSIDLPVHVYRAEEEGPVLLLTGGLHGDEINGIEIIRRMIRGEMTVPEKGTVIAMPLVNVYGFIQSVRGVPDGKDINRSFPGAKSGSLARLLAHTLMNEIIPKIDYGIDFHTGGASRANFPQIRCTLEIDMNRKLAHAFAPPVIVNSRLIDKSFRKAAYKKNKHILVFESGESQRFDEQGIEEGIRGTLRVMKYLGMRSEAPAGSEPEVYQKTTWIRARYSGLFLPKVLLGEHVDKQQLLGVITDPFGRESFRTLSTKKGRVIGINNAPVVNKGDALLHIAFQPNDED